MFNASHIGGNSIVRPRWLVNFGHFLQEEPVLFMELKKSSSVGPERSYAEYQAVEHLSFDPLTALNLPATYEEVVRRYKRLRSQDQGPSLN